MPPSKTVVEYAKSGWSACKKCSNTISRDAVRVGAVVIDPRRFEFPKWHHLHCFPFSSQSSASSVDAIAGFSSLKSIDQEAMKKLFGHPENISEEGSDGRNRFPRLMILKKLTMRKNPRKERCPYPVRKIRWILLCQFLISRTSTRMLNCHQSGKLFRQLFFLNEMKALRIQVKLLHLILMVV